MHPNLEEDDKGIFEYILVCHWVLIQPATHSTVPGKRMMNDDTRKLHHARPTTMRLVCGKVWSCRVDEVGISARLAHRTRNQ